MRVNTKYDKWYTVHVVFEDGLKRWRMCLENADDLLVQFVDSWDWSKGKGGVYALHSNDSVYLRIRSHWTWSGMDISEGRKLWGLLQKFGFKVE